MLNRKFNRIPVLLILAILIGSIYIYPDIRFIYELKNNYRGITITAANDELHYLAIINTFNKGGDFTLAGYDNYEHKGQPWTLGLLPEFILGFLGRGLKISVTQLDILMSFILPALLFILIYILYLKLSDSQGLSLIGSASVVLGYHLFTGKIWLLKNIFSLKYAEPLWFLRPISPQFNHVGFILSLLLIYIALNSRKKIFSLVSGIVLGLQFYIFPYSLTFIYAGLFTLVLIFMMKKDFTYIRSASYIFLTSLLLSVPYFINFWRLAHSPYYGNFMRLIHLMYTHKPVLPLLHIFLTIFIIAAYYKKKHDFSFYFIASFLAAGFLCLNQQIITGKLLFPDHWERYSNKTFLIIALFVSLKNFKDINIINKMIKNIFINRFIVGLALCALAVLAFSQQNNFFNKHKPFYKQKQSLYSALAWLKEHTDKNDVVLTDPFNYMIRPGFPDPFDPLVYSHNFTFLSVAGDTLQSKEETEDRYLVGLAILGYNQKEVRSFCSYNNGVSFLYLSALKEFGGKGISNEYLNYLEDKYITLQQYEKLVSALTRYRLDYILVGNSTPVKNGILYKKGLLSKVYNDDEFIILKLNKNFLSKG